MAVGVQHVEDEVVGLRHHPAVAGVGDLVTPLLVGAGGPLEAAVDQRVDVRDADLQQLLKVGLGVLLGAVQVGDRLHGALEERVADLRVGRRVGGAVRVDRADDLNELAYVALLHPLGVLEQPHGEGRVAVHVVDVHGVPVGVEAEE